MIIVEGGDSMTREELCEKLVYYDFEVFEYDWLVVLRRHIDNSIQVIVNDEEELKRYISQDIIMCGYNNKNYDRYILKAILSGENPKKMNDWIIVYNQPPWEYRYENLTFNLPKIPPQIDLMQDTLGLSLKEIEGNIGMDIKESSIPFDIDRPLGSEEIAETIEYCKADVSVLPKLWEIRKDYINAKIMLCEMSNIPLEEGLGMTNAKLTARFLNASKIDTPPRRSFDYSKIPNIDWEYIPLEVLEFFDNVLDTNITDEELEGMKLKIDIKGCPHIIAFGGIHGALENCKFETDSNTIIKNYDISSMYPTIVLHYGYVSRAVQDKKLYEQVYHDRLKAKKEGNKAVANAFKLVVNTFYRSA